MADDLSDLDAAFAKGSLPLSDAEVGIGVPKADDLSDWDAAFGNPASPSAPSAPSAPASDYSSMFPGEEPPLTVRAHDKAPPPEKDDLSDWDAAFSGGAPGKGPQPAAPSTPNTTGPLANAPDEGWLSGLAKGAGTATIKGLSNIPGQIGNLGNFADYLVARGESAITGKPYEQVAQEQQVRRVQMEAASPLLKFTNPSNVFPTGAEVAAPILKQTGEYVPTTEAGRMAQAGVEAATSMIGPGAGVRAPGATLGQTLIKAPARMAPANIVAGAAGQGVTDVTQDPLWGLAAGVVAPVVAGIPGRIAGAVSKPFFAGSREAMVAEQLRSAAANPQAAEVALNQPNPQIIPGSQPTLGQLTGDVGILQAERQARTLNNTGFNLREGEQNQARLEALRSAAPANADTMKPSEAFQSHLANIDQATDVAVDQLGSRAQDLAAQLGPGRTPEDVGTAIRGGIETIRGEAKAAKNALYDAIDPDGSLNVVAAPLRDKFNKIRSGINEMEARPTGEEAQLYKLANTISNVIPFKSLQAIDSRITAAMSAERRVSGETPVWRRLAQMKSATMDTIANAAENQMAYEHAQAARGTAAPGSRLSEVLNRQVTGEGPENAWPGARMAPGQEPTPSSTRGPAYVRQPQTLVGFLRAHGGIRDEGGELASRDLSRQFPGLVNNRSGMRLDTAREAAAQNGHLGADTDRAVHETTVNDLLDKIDQHPTYSVHDTDAVLSRQERTNWQEQQRQLSDARDEIAKGRQAHGMRGHDPELDHAAAGLMVDHGMNWDDAVERAGINAENSRNEDLYDAALSARAPQGAKDVRSEGAPNLRPGGERISGTGREAPWTNGGVGVQTQANPNFDEAAAARLAAAKSAHAEYARTYRQGPVAPTLKGPFQGNYTMPASAVPARAFVKGDRGYQTVKSFLAASKNDPDVLAALQDHALNPLRDSLNPDGTVNPKKFAAWRSDYADSLRAMNEASPGFSDRFSSAAKATDEMMKAGLDRKAQLDAFQKTAAAKFIGKTNPVEVENQLGLILRNKAAGPTQMRGLVNQAKTDPQALDGLRKAGVDWMLREFSTAAEAPGTGEKVIASAGFRKFVNENRATLAELYPEQQVNMFGAIADDLQRADRSVTATAIKGSPGTAKDIGPFLKQAAKAASHGGDSLIGLATMLEAMHGGLNLHTVAWGAAGAAGLYLKHALENLKQAGIAKTGDMLRDALLNPDRARYYLEKHPATEKGLGYALSRSLRRALITQPMLVPQQ